MPKIFPEIWVGRVENTLKTTNVAPFLVGITEVSTPVITLGEGTKTEKNIIHIPTSDFEPEVLINNSTYPISLQNYDDDSVEIALDKYQTKVTTLSDDDIMGASYDKIDNATKGHTSAIASNKYIKAIHALAPQADSEKTPIVKTTGDADGTRKKMKLADIIALKKKFDKMQVPNMGRRLVLCADHVADLLELDQRFATQYYNYTTGKIADLYGFEVFEYVANPYFDSATNTKKSFGAIPTDTDFQASVAFYTENVAIKTGDTKQYFSESKTDPENQTNKLNYRHYYICVPKRAMAIGAIVSASV